MRVSCADLELALYRAEGGYSVKLRFTPADSSAPVRLLDGDPPLVALDEPALAALHAARLDMEAYAATLSDLFYHDPRLREALERARAASFGVGAALRLRLMLDERVPALHTLHWEALSDPGGNGPLLSMSERVRFSRFLSSADLEPLRPRPLAAMSALVVVANPADLDAYQLAPIDLAAETARARAALGELPLTLLCSAPAEPITLTRLISALREGPDILYLIAHGTLHREQPFLWLEDDEGLAARVNAKLLVEQLQALARRPLLVILGSCQSAGNSAVEGTLNALGPQLAAAGIGAVLAMQGNVAMSDAAVLLPIFLRELRRDGQVDRAAGAARAALREHGSWWQPVLWLRVLDGQLWTETPTPDLPPPPPAEAPHNLPAQLEPLIGRERELEETVRLLAEPATRSLTLVGPGGAGKTRLAIELAWQLRSHFPDGIFFIELTTLREPALLLPAIAHTLGLKEEAGHSLAETLYAYLRPRTILLILDNFEQIVAAAPQLAQLLAAAPTLDVLVTSRVALRITGEREYLLNPLPLPDPVNGSARPEERIAALHANAAVALFVRRASAVHPDFTLSEQNMEAISQIVRQIDGLPLAIELAAARTRMLTPQALLSRLNDSLDLLTGGARERAAHQQTLRATITWSYDLLSPPEQRLFARLAVFAGGCTLEAAEAVCNPDGDLELDILDGIGELVADNLLRAQHLPDATTSFAMLVTIRDFALERLGEDPAAERLWQHFAAYHLELAQRYDNESRTVNPGLALDQIEHHYANLRAVLEWAVATDAAESACALGEALWYFWYVRGHLSEGRGWLARLAEAYAQQIPATRLATLQYGAGNLAQAQADYQAAEQLFTTALAHYQNAADRLGMTRTLNSLGTNALRQGQYTQAQSAYTQSLQICRELDLRAGVTTLLNNLGLLAMDQADFATARPYLEESLALARLDADTPRMALALSNLGLVAVFEGAQAEAVASLDAALPLYQALGNRAGVAMALRNRGLAALLAGTLEQAASLFRESLTLRRDLIDRNGIAYCLEGLASVAARHDDPLRAARFWGAADALRQAIPAPLPPAERALYEREVAAAQAASTPEAFAVARAAGAALSFDQTISEALAA